MRSMNRQLKICKMVFSIRLMILVKTVDAPYACAGTKRAKCEERIVSQMYSFPKTVYCQGPSNGEHCLRESVSFAAKVLH